MRHFILYILLGFVPVYISCNQGSPNGNNRKREHVDIVLYSNYLKAVRNEGTFQYFVVVTVKNTKTGDIREICTSGNFLVGALHMENSIGYDSTDNIKIDNILSKNRKLYFEFKKNSALNNLGLSSYSKEELESFEKTHNIDSLARVLRNGKWSMRMPNDKTMLLYAHSLFKRGVMTGEYDCFGGALVSVEKED
jgi:hypothetical protein